MKLISAAVTLVSLVMVTIFKPSTVNKKEVIKDSLKQELHYRNLCFIQEYKNFSDSLITVAQKKNDSVKQHIKEQLKDSK